MGRAVKEFGTARDEIEKGLNQSGPSGGAQAKLLEIVRVNPEGPAAEQPVKQRSTR
jgi:hypothetical protein